ncbi:MAG: putative lipid II flippase FtsW [Clostridia bacterium]|nr:putative lipid II flippase FtsW [Clostridia bacterium]
MIRAKRRPAAKNIGSASRRPELNIKNIRNTVKTVDTQFLASVYVLLAFGLIMVLSASSPIAYASSSTNHDSFYYFKRQLLWAAFGSVAMFITANYDYRKLKNWAFPIFAASVFLLILVLVPGIGRKINDARRWIYIGPINFQPSEVAKIATIIFFSYSLSMNYKELDKFSIFIMYIAIIGVMALIIMMEPHFSCTMLIAATACILLLVAGAKMTHFMALGLCAVPAIVLMVAKAPYRLARVVTFLDPFQDIQGSGWQIVQSLYAIGSGGIFGAGIGQSRQKYMNIPEPQNDFIFSILAEEFGLLGAILVVLMFIFLIVRGIKIALNAPDLFGTLLATGIVSMIAIQAIVNIAVVTSSMPVTGMPLPFFSYGGTALAITMAEMGIVLNISRHCKNMGKRK